MIRKLTPEEEGLVSGGFVFTPPLPVTAYGLPTGNYFGQNYIINSGNGNDPNGGSYTTAISQNYSFGGIASNG
jgi:hypothetical protein